MLLDQFSKTHPSNDSVFGGIINLSAPYRILSVAFFSCAFGIDVNLGVFGSPTGFLHPNPLLQTQRRVF